MSEYFFKLKLMILILLFISNCSHYPNNSTYPLTDDEIRLSSVGSILNLDLNYSNKNLKKRLWDASLSILNNAPLVSSNFSSGVIITDWYFIDNNISNKILIIIKKDKPLIEVFQRNKLLGDKYIILSKKSSDDFYQRIMILAKKNEL